METRRDFLRTCACAAFSGCVSRVASNDRLKPWSVGCFDIHFIHTGVGEQTFFIFPDGTTMLLDCGDTHHAKYMKDVPPAPDSSRYGGEWVSRYIQRLIPQREIDYVMASHWHGDHVGDLMFGGKRTADGRIVCGLPLVGEDFRFRHYIDRQYPLMAEGSLDPDEQAISLMREWLPRACADGMQPHRFEVGALNQIKMLRDGSSYHEFEVRNIAANAVIWDGADGTVDFGKIHREQTGGKLIHENRLSAVLRFRYGDFSYYTGGDAELTLVGADGREFNWEEMIGRAVGPVSVCKTNHHAGSLGMSPEFVREIRAKAYLSSVWQAKMVDHKSLSSMCSRELYPGERMVCFGHIAHCVKDIAAAYGDDIPPVQGHTVVRVPPGGATFGVFIVDASDESMRVVYSREFSSVYNN